MKTMGVDVAKPEPRNQVSPNEARQERENRAEVQHERWARCHVNWSAVSIGALATFSVVVLFGLVGVALGAHLLGAEHRVVDLKNLGLWTLIFSVCGAFFSAVIGGWVAAKIAGTLHSEPAMLHGAFVWLLTVPILVVCAGLGAASLLGGWYGSLGTTSGTSASTPFAQPDPIGASATADEIAAFKTQHAEYTRNVKQWREDTPKVTRNSAWGAVTALLLALLGSVLGAWMASGEAMNFTYYQTRKPRYDPA